MRYKAIPIPIILLTIFEFQVIIIFFSQTFADERGTPLGLPNQARCILSLSNNYAQH